MVSDQNERVFRENIGCFIYFFWKTRAHEALREPELKLNIFLLSKTWLQKNSEQQDRLYIAF